jgi:hypothetical protein
MKELPLSRTGFMASLWWLTLRSPTLEVSLEKIQVWRGLAAILPEPRRAIERISNFVQIKIDD